MIPAPPPPIWNLLAGTHLHAGLGYTTILPDFDFETYSEAGYVWNEGPRKWICLPNASQGKKGLVIVGAQVYAEHSTTDILCLYYDLKDGMGRRMWKPGMAPPYDLHAHVLMGGLLEAWNSSFEWRIWNWVGVRRYGWPPLPLHLLRCAMAKSRAHALPGGLGPCGTVLRLQYPKLAEGDRLIKKFSVPQNPTAKRKGTRIFMADEPMDGPAMLAYNERDIVTEAEASARIPDLSEEELANWLMDQEINTRGVQMDRDGIANCIAIVEQAHAHYDAELAQITGGLVLKSSELPALQAWLRTQGTVLPNMKKATLEAALAEDRAISPERRALHAQYKWAIREAMAADDSVDEEDMPGDESLAGPVPMTPTARRALEIRQLIGSAAVKKLFAMSNCLNVDGRMFDLFSYYGAHTGRTTGNGAQPTNLPKSGPDVIHCLYLTPDASAHGYEKLLRSGWTDAQLVQHGHAFGCGRFYGSHAQSCPWCGGGRPAAAQKREWSWRAAQDALLVISTRQLAQVEHYFGNAVATVSGCLRGLFIAGPGMELICSDYSAIEAVVLAMLAKVQWRIDVFRTHGKIYETSGALIGKVSVEDVLAHKKLTGQHHPLRAKGKVAELALGFGGWIGSMIAFGADAYMTEEEMKETILAWRAASPEIPEFWGGQWRRTRAGWIPELFGVEGAFVNALLHPGQQFDYNGFKFLLHGEVLYLTLLSGRHMKYHKPYLTKIEKYGRWQYEIHYEGWNTNPKNGATGWIRRNTYGGRLTENIVQATARDIQWHGMRNLRAAGYPIVLHVYDEDIAEVPVGFGSVEQFEAIMSTMPVWAQGWPIKAQGGWTGDRYRKD